jgi:lipoprotein-anchoring transpeptidase ErfK/SrfK
MTRVRWFFVLALVSAMSYGLLQAEQPVRGEQLEAAQPALLPAMAAATLAPTTPAVTTPLPEQPTVTATATTAAAATTAATATTVASATVAPTATAVATWTPVSTSTATNGPLPSATPQTPQEPSPTLTPTVQPPPPLNTYPEEPRFVYIDQYNQRLMIFVYGELLRDIPCSTGLPESDKYTPAARGRVGGYWPTFTSFGVEADDAWYLYKSSGSILIHSLPYTRGEQGAKVYQDRDALGVRPSSHGCIRIAPEDAVWLTAWNPEGALFEVTEPYLQKWFAPQ